MFWNIFGKKKKNNNRKNSNEAISNDVLAVSRKSLEAIIVDRCEQLAAISQTLAEDKREYEIVTSQLNDILFYEEMDEKAQKEIIDIATNLNTMEQQVMEYRTKEQKISQAQFRQMQELEDEIPGAIRRMQENEKYLETIKRDMHYLEAEKTEWMYLKQDAKEQTRLLGRISVILLVVLASAAVLLFLVKQLLKVDITVLLVLLGFLVLLICAYILLKHQENQKLIKKAGGYINRAITLENHVKIRYVTTKNAIDYTMEKYHVSNSREFEYIWDCYHEAVVEHTRYQQNRDDMEYYREKLLRYLRKYHFYDPNLWLTYTAGIVNPKEMVEIKHDLLERRKRLREQIAYSTTSLETLRGEVERELPHMKVGREKVELLLSTL